MLHKERQDIEAYIDGELNEVKRRQVALQISKNKEWMTYYQKIILQKKRLLQWWNANKKN